MISCENIYTKFWLAHQMQCNVIVHLPCVDLFMLHRCTTVNSKCNPDVNILSTPICPFNQSGHRWCNCVVIEAAAHSCYTLRLDWKTCRLSALNSTWLHFLDQWSVWPRSWAQGCVFECLRSLWFTFSAPCTLSESLQLCRLCMREKPTMHSGVTSKTGDDSRFLHHKNPKLNACVVVCLMMAAMVTSHILIWPKRTLLHLHKKQTTNCPVH